MNNGGGPFIFACLLWTFIMFILPTLRLDIEQKLFPTPIRTTVAIMIMIAVFTRTRCRVHMARASLPAQYKSLFTSYI